MKNFSICLLLIISLLNTNIKSSAKNHYNEKNTLLPPAKKAFVIYGIDSEISLNNKIVEYLKEIEINQNYFQIELSETKVPFPTLKDFNPENISDDDKTLLFDWLNSQKTGQAILSEWFNLQPDGSFNLDKLQDAGFIQKTAKNNAESKRSFPKNISAKLAATPVNDSYVVVFDFRDVQTMNEYYTRSNTAEQDRILSGFIAEVNTYIFKLDFNRSVAQKFLTDYYFKSNDSEAKAKKEAFGNSEFPFFFVSMHKDEIASVQHRKNQNISPNNAKSDEELMSAMAQLSVNNIFELIDKGKISLLPDQVVRSTNPVTAKIGAAQQVKFDQRYGIYQNRITPNGKVKTKRVSMVKAIKVADNFNKQGSDKSYSAFYRIAGGKIIPNQVYLKRRFDTGINVYMGNTFTSLAGTTGRFEYYFSKALGGAVLPGKTATGLTSVKLYFEAAQNKKSYQLFNQSNFFTFNRGSIGIEKEYHPFGFMHLGPFIGYGLEYATWKNSDYLLSTNFAELGARLGINIRHNLQIISSATYYLIIKSVMMDNNRNVAIPDFDYFGAFNDRPGFGYSIGIRIML